MCNPTPCATQPVVEIANIFVSPEASPTNLVAVTSPVTGSKLIADPTSTSPEKVAVSPTPSVVAVVNPVIFTFPITSRDSVGIDVPIPTRPLALTMKLSLSTWTPLRKLKDFL